MEKRKEWILKAIYLLLAIPMFYYVSQDITLGGVGFMFRYLFGMAIVGLALLMFLISPNMKRMVMTLRYAGILCLPYLWTLLYSMVVWVLGYAPVKVMSRGFFFVIYEIIAVLAAGSALYLFGKKGVFLQLSALLAANAVYILKVIRLNGANAFFREYIRLIVTMTGDTGPIMKSFEVLGYSYALGLFLVYFFLNRRESEKYVGLAVLSTACFLLGLKRSVLLAVVVACAAGIILNRMPGRFGRRISAAVCWIGIGAAVCYVAACSRGLFHWLEAMGINTNSRIDVLDYFRPYYEMSPGFLGHGAGFVSGMMASGELTVNVNGYIFGDIHNDFLRQYIELGAFGFCIWLWLFLNVRVKYFFHKEWSDLGCRHGILSFCFILTVFVTFMTENAYYHYYTTLSMSVMIMAFGYEQFEKEAKIGGNEKT